jgi:predicted transcriptional regulator
MSDAEREVLRALWDQGSGTVRETKDVLADRGRRWAYTTVATLLQRLQAKHYVIADTSVVPHMYKAVVTREQLLDRRLKDAAEELCDGQAAPLILALVQSNRFSEAELVRMRRMLDEAAGKSKPKKSKS